MRLTDASKLTTRGLRILRDHNIVDLEARGLARATITDLIGSLGDWTVANVRTFNVAESTFLVRVSPASLVDFQEKQSIKYAGLIEEYVYVTLTPGRQQTRSHGANVSAQKRHHAHRQWHRVQ